MPTIGLVQVDGRRSSRRRRSAPKEKTPAVGGGQPVAGPWAGAGWGARAARPARRRRGAGPTTGPPPGRRPRPATGSGWRARIRGRSWTHWSPVAGFERVEGAAADGPDQAPGHDGRAVGPGVGLPVGHRGGVGVGVTARSPSLQGTKTVPFRSAAPPSGSLPQKSAVDGHLAADAAEVGLVRARRRCADLPTWKTSPFGSSAGARRAEVLVVGVVAVPGGRGEGVEQLHGRTQLDHTVAVVVGGRPVAALLPVATQTSPWASMTGAAPPIHTAPWLSPGWSATTNVDGAEPSSGAEITRPW